MGAVFLLKKIKFYHLLPYNPGFYPRLKKSGLSGLFKVVIENLFCTCMILFLHIYSELIGDFHVFIIKIMILNNLIFS